MLEVSISPSSGLGYLWDPEDAVAARREHRLLGSYIGGVALFKSQNSVNGLPLQLGKDEVALALSQGWARAQAPVLKGLQDILLPAPQQGSQEDEDVPGTSQPQGPTYRPGYRAHGGPRKRRRTGEDEMTAQYVMYYELLGAYGASRQAAARQRLVEEQQQQQQQQQQQLHSPSLQRQQQQQAAKPATSQVPSKQAQEKAALAPEKQQQKQKSSTGADAAPQGGGPGWKAAVADGSAVFTVPMTGREAAQAEGRLLPDQDISSQVVETYPRSPEEQLRHAVFQDLHTRGYTQSAGPKFGCDIMAYPEDPSLVHGYFAVRVCPLDVPISTAALKSAARGSHAARKHLVLATELPPETGTSQAGQVAYISIAPELHFGHGKDK